MTRNPSMLIVAATTAVLMIAICGSAFARGGDVCVCVKGESKIQKGDAACFSDPSSRAVAVNDSGAVAVQYSTAVGVDDSQAVATGHCVAFAAHGARQVC
jgi:hypothetical protein